MASAQGHERGRNGHRSQAESDREFSFNLGKLGADDVQPETAPRHLAFQGRTVAVPDGEAVPGHRADSVHPAAPRERRVSPAESDFQDAVNRVDRYSVPQAVISHSSGRASRVHDGTPAATPRRTWYSRSSTMTRSRNIPILASTGTPR